MEMRQKDFEIPDLPVKDLVRMRTELDVRIAEQRELDKYHAAERLKQVAQDLGFQIPELLPLLEERADLPVRYRHPENPELTWCGKGRRPLWMTKAIAAGMNLSDLAA